MFPFAVFRVPSKEDYFHVEAKDVEMQNMNLARRAGGGGGTGPGPQLETRGKEPEFGFLNEQTSYLAK